MGCRRRVLDACTAITRWPEKPFTLDSKAPTLGYEDFLRGESRYSALDITFPENAKELFARAAEQARRRYESYAKMAERQ